jgi:hypothetical protein
MAAQKKAQEEFQEAERKLHAVEDVVAQMQVRSASLVVIVVSFQTRTYSCYSILSVNHRMRMSVSFVCFHIYTRY